MRTENYKPYDKEEIEILVNEPWEIRDQPYRLHAAFALSCLFDLLADTEDDEDEEHMVPEDIWGKKIPSNILDGLVRDIAQDFNDAAMNRKPLKVWGKSYSVRKANAYDHGRLAYIFNFPKGNGEYVITQDGVMNLAGIPFEPAKKYEISKQEAENNRTYVRQVIALAENDAEDGWNKLTDMEIIVYCWALFYSKRESENLKQFMNEYKDYMYVSEADIKSCFNAKSEFRLAPTGMYPFSEEKVEEWNRSHKQTSKASEVSKEEADDYWYEMALKGNFKPMN